MIKRIGLLTSGGDAPGMNATICAVTKTAERLGIEVFGITEGYYGLYHDQIKPLTYKDTQGIMNRGGTILASARFPEFKDEATRKEAIKNLDKLNIDALIVIGGDGSYMGAVRLSEMGYPCIGIPGTIDNDAPGTDFTIGFDTALNTIVEAVDRLIDTSTSHRRCSIVQVMGRNAGDLAIWAAISTDAEVCIVPEFDHPIENIVEQIKSEKKSGKKHFIILLAEGVKIREELVQRIEVETGIETRATVLGHIQRGGAPSAVDRVLAVRMGCMAVELLIQGKSAQCIGIVDNKLIYSNILETIDSIHTVSEELYNIANNKNRSNNE